MFLLQELYALFQYDELRTVLSKILWTFLFSFFFHSVYIEVNPGVVSHILLDYLNFEDNIWT